MTERSAPIDIPTSPSSTRSFGLNSPTFESQSDFSPSNGVFVNWPRHTNSLDHSFSFNVNLNNHNSLSFTSSQPQCFRHSSPRISKSYEDLLPTTQIPFSTTTINLRKSSDEMRRQQRRQFQQQLQHDFQHQQYQHQHQQHQQQQQQHQHQQQVCGLSSSECVLVSSFVGSFEESLLSGRMSDTPTTMFQGFIADIGVMGKDFIAADHLKVPFDTVYYHVLDHLHPTPYVATIELPPRQRFRIPPLGLLQVTIFNPSKTPIKTFLVKYDIHDMPGGTKTFMRQKVVSQGGGGGGGGTRQLVQQQQQQQQPQQQQQQPQQQYKLHYAIQVKFSSPQKKKYYLHHNMRVLFPHRIPDEPDSLKTFYQYPDNPRYFPLS